MVAWDYIKPSVQSNKYLTRLVKYYNIFDHVEVVYKGPVWSEGHV